jgi:hypothetical protein
MHANCALSLFSSLSPHKGRSFASHVHACIYAYISTCVVYVSLQTDKQMTLIHGFLESSCLPLLEAALQGLAGSHET